MSTTTKDKGKDKMLTRRTFLQTTAFGLAGFVLPPTIPIVPPPPPDTSNRLVIVGMDGVGLDVVQELMAQNRLPNLASLASQGCLIPLDSIGLTVTIPSWAHLATGLVGAYTGVLGNYRYQGGTMTTNPASAQVWLRQIYCGGSNETIIMPLIWAGHKAAWHVSKQYLGDNPLHGPFATLCSKVHDYVLCYAKDAPDTYLEELTDRTIGFIQAQAGGFLVFHHQNQDCWGHQYGSRSPEFFAQVERGDYHLGRIMAAAAAKGAGVMVVSDHGFNRPTAEDPNPRTHGNAPYQFLCTNLPINPCWQGGGAKLVDVAATVLSVYGLGLHHAAAWGRNLV